MAMAEWIEEGEYHRTRLLIEGSGGEIVEAVDERRSKRPQRPRRG